MVLSAGLMALIIVPWSKVFIAGGIFSGALNKWAGKYKESSRETKE